jgi:hypothetical protein
MPSVERSDNSMSVVICGRWGARPSPINPDKAANKLYLVEADSSCTVLPAVARQNGKAQGKLVVVQNQTTGVWGRDYDPVSRQEVYWAGGGELTCSAASQGRLPGHISPAPTDSIPQPEAAWAPLLLVPAPPASLW